MPADGLGKASGMVDGPQRDRFLHVIRHDPVLTVAIAEGVLAERYQVNHQLASWLLAHRAQRAGLQVVEAAHWLLAAGSLPRRSPRGWTWAVPALLSQRRNLNVPVSRATGLF